ncbi:MAG: DUF4405 domain-containing protein [Treponema sp.]|nr:DUF4405 domain-containing protein [Treponema sp.]
MNLARKIRMPIDIAMTLLSIILMGGNYFFPADIVHEILGVALLLLWAVHIALNRRWYGAIFRGSYNPYRVMQTVINCGILICAIFLMISGIILSNHIFTFLGIEKGLGFARIAHLLASHWYFLFMSMHIGLHVSMIANKMCHKERTACHPELNACHPELVSGSPGKEMPKQARHDSSSTRHNRLRKILLFSILALACLYGIYAFIIRGVWKYLILQQQFFFFDLERGYILFAIDYISIIILFAAISHFVAAILKKNR